RVAVDTGTYLDQFGRGALLRGRGDLGAVLAGSLAPLAHGPPLPGRGTRRVLWVLSASAARQPASRPQARSAPEVWPVAIRRRAAGMSGSCPAMPRRTAATSTLP